MYIVYIYIYIYIYITFNVRICIYMYMSSNNILVYKHIDTYKLITIKYRIN